MDRKNIRRILVACVFLLCIALGVYGYHVYTRTLHLPSDSTAGSATRQPEKLTSDGGPALPQTYSFPSYTSNPAVTNTLVDLALLNKARLEEFISSFPSRIECGRHYHEFFLIPRPPHESDILMRALEDATSQSPYDLEQIYDVCRIVCYGGYDARLIEKFRNIINGLQKEFRFSNRNRKAERISSDSNSALSVCSMIQHSSGYISDPISVDFLMSMIPEKQIAPVDPGLWDTTEARWEIGLCYGALNGVKNLPPHLSIPVLEHVVQLWFPGVPPTTCTLEDTKAQDDLRGLLRMIDGAYRKKYNEPPIEPWDIITTQVIDPDWPEVTFRYGPGGLKLPWWNAE